MDGRKRRRSSNHEDNRAKSASVPTSSGLDTNHKTDSRSRSAAQIPPNVSSVVLGDRRMTPWFASMHREELVKTDQVDTLFVCERCFKYTTEGGVHVAHSRRCSLSHYVPGKIVYENDGYVIYEVDGEDHHLFAQNLSLFAKLFIENKSICFDVNTFLYYLLVEKSRSNVAAKGKLKDGKKKVQQPQIVAFFSKEKLSWDNNNLACILVFPPWQRLGLGQMLMGASYELARREGRLGGPEKPLSQRGRKSYYNYWSRKIAQALLKTAKTSKLPLEDLSSELYMSTDDIVYTLVEMGVLGITRKDGSVKVDKGRIKRWLKDNSVDLSKVPIDMDGFISEEIEESEEEGAEEEESASEEEEEEEKD